MKSMQLLAVCFVALVMLASVGDANAGMITATNSTSANVDPPLNLAIREVVFHGGEPGFGSGTVQDVNISINFAKAQGTDFEPPYDEPGLPSFDEIHFELRSPADTLVSLIPAFTFAAGGNGDVFDGTITLDDEVLQFVNQPDGLPHPGTFKPINPLSVFDGEHAAGTWSLYVYDDIGDDSVRFREFTLTVQTPEPSSASLVAVACFCLLGWTRRRLRRNGLRP